MKPLSLATGTLMVLAISLSNTLGSTTALGQDSVTHRLLKELWDGGVQQRREAESLWQQYRSANANLDPQVQWAYVLNQLAYGRFREARQGFEDFPVASASWDQRYTMIWLQMSVGEVNSGLLKMQDLKTDFAATGEVTEEERTEMYSRMGRLFGFAEGPAADKATLEVLKKTRRVITDGLDDLDFGNFEDHRKQVIDEYARLVEEKTSTAEQKARDRMASNRAESGQLQNDNAQMNLRQQVLNEELGKLRDEAAEAVGELRQSARPIESDLSRVDTRIRELDYDLSIMRGDIANLEFAAANEPDPFIRDRYLREARFIRSDLFRAERDRVAMQGEYNTALSQLERLSQEIASVEQQYNGQISLREEESRQILSQQRRNQRKISQLNNPIARTGYERAMNARTGHLPTYDPFPIDSFRHAALK